jgi:hypothetical protein
VTPCRAEPPLESLQGRHGFPLPRRFPRPQSVEETADAEGQALAYAGDPVADHARGLFFTTATNGSVTLAMQVSDLSAGCWRGIRRLAASPLNPTHEGKHMHKSLIALVGAAGIGIAAMVAPAPANAECVGCAVGAGILGGVAAGAIIGNAIANSPPPGYYPPPPAYYRPPPPAYAYGGRGCWQLRQACLHKEELGEEGMGNCQRYRELCR